MSSVLDQIGYPAQYVANFNLNGAADPTLAGIVRNTLPGIILWTRLAAGLFQGVPQGFAFPGAIVQNRVVLHVEEVAIPIAIPRLGLLLSSNVLILFSTTNAALAGTDFLSVVQFRIEVL